MNAWIEELNSIDGIMAIPEAMISSHTPLRVGGIIDAWIRCQNRKALKKAASLFRKQNWKIHWPFQDCLFRDGKQKGVLLRLEGEFEQIIQTQDMVQLGSSALWSQLGAIGLGKELQHWPSSVGALFENNPQRYFRGLKVELEWFSGRSFQTQEISNWKTFQLPTKAIITQVRITGKRKRPSAKPLGSGFVFVLPKAQMPDNILQALSLDSVRLHDWRISSEDPNRIVHLGKNGFSDLQLLQKALNQRLKQVHNTTLEIRLPIYGRKP